MSPSVRLSAVDAHVGGGVLRLVTAGLPAPRGRTMSDKAEWLRKRHDALCRSLVLEPRGGTDVTLGVLCEPADPAADAGVVFRRADGFVPFSGTGAMALAVLAAREGLVHARQPDRLRLDTGLGLVDVHVDGAAARLTGTPSFVLAGGLPVTVAGRAVRVDVAWGGAFFAIVDSESAGLALTPDRGPDFARLARPIAAAVESTVGVAHPTEPTQRGIAGVIFVGDPGSTQLRCLVTRTDGSVARSASGTGLAALLAVFDAMGLVTDDEVQVEGVAGVPLAARIRGRTLVETVPAVLVEIAGAAWTIGRHEFVLENGDPLRHGAAR